MSRYAIDPPDDDRYSEKPIDAADEPQDGEPWIATVEGRGSVLVTPLTGTEVNLRAIAIDPAEHAAHALIDALATLEQEIVKADTLERAHALKQLIKRHYDQVNRVDLLASATIDLCMERRR